MGNWLKKALIYFSLCFGIRTLFELPESLEEFFGQLIIAVMRSVCGAVLTYFIIALITTVYESFLTKPTNEDRMNIDYAGWETIRRFTLFAIGFIALGGDNVGIVLSQFLRVFGEPR